MSKLQGKYAFERNEKYDDYMKAIGIPYMGRTMMSMASPSLEITETDGEWQIVQKTMMRTSIVKFKLNEEYEELMPGGSLKNTATVEGDKLIISSVGPEDKKLTRTYEATETGCVIIFKDGKSGVEGRRYFTRT